jgi:hypothetical protein
LEKLEEEGYCLSSSSCIQPCSCFNISLKGLCHKIFDLRVPIPGK